MRPTGTLLDAARDLLLGSGCTGCGAPGRPLCAFCARLLPRGGRVSWPVPVPAPPGLAPPYAAGPYGGLLRALVNEHKEHGVLALATPLGEVLGSVVRDLVRDQAAGSPDRGTEPVLVLVPVPSRAAVVRRRGHDPLLRMTRVAARVLREDGTRTRVQRAVVGVRRVHDQSGLGATARAENLHGSMRARAGRGPGDPERVVVVDDVLTTGSTAREVQRALEEAGRPVAGIAVLAATRLRRAERGLGRVAGGR